MCGFGAECRVTNEIVVPFCLHYCCGYAPARCVYVRVCVHVCASRRGEEEDACITHTDEAANRQRVACPKVKNHACTIACKRKGYRGSPCSTRRSSIGPIP